MKNTKKVLSVALAGALAFGSMGAAFAAAPVMDAKTDKKVTEAVERLAAFGIVSGMEDGKYHEEAKVTREQFAKLLVEALGLGSAADAAKGSTKFGDVESSRWSAGYINVAAGQGLIKGYADGSFQPAAEVSYAEAVTMLVRALGYKDEFLKGTWPGNYVAKAADAGITDGAKFADAAGKADRGTVALLVDNTLDGKVVKVTEYVDGQIKYGETEKTLLEDKLEIKEYKNIRLVANERIKAGLNSDEAEFKSTKDNNEFVKSTDFDKDQVEKIDIAETLNTDSLMGLKVKVYVNDDDQVVFMQRDGSETTAVDVVTKVNGSTKEVDLLVLDDTYDATGTAYVAEGGKKVVDGTVYNKVTAGMFGKFIVENNDIVFADAVKADVNGLIVKKVDTTEQEITGILGTDDDESVNLKDDYDKIIIRDANGKTLELKDIKENNVVYVVKSEIDGDDVAVVTVVQNNEIKGKLDKVKSDKIEVAGKEYKLTKDYTGNDPDNAPTAAFYSINKGSDIYSYNVNDTKLEDADGADVVAVTDIAGRVLYLTTDVKSTSDDMYGVVTKEFSESESFKIYLPKEDKEVTYKLEETNDLSRASVGDFVKFSLNKDGEIADGEITNASTSLTVLGGGTAEFGKDSITTTGSNAGTYSVDSKDTILMAETAAAVDGVVTLTGAYVDSDNLDSVNWTDIKEDKISANISARAFIDSKGEIEAILFLDNGVSGASDDEQAAYVIDAWKKGEDKMVKVELHNGGIKEIELDAGTASKENAYVVKVKSNGKLALVSNTDGNTTDFSIVSGTVYDKDGDYIKLFTDSTSGVNANGKWDAGEAVGTVYYRTDSNTVIYDEDEKKKLSNVTKGTKVQVIVEEGKEARVIEIQ